MENTVEQPRQNYVVLNTKRFTELPQILADENFLINVRERFNEVQRQRNSRPEPKPGFHYARNAWDMAKNNGLLHLEVFLKEYPLIYMKKSSMSAVLRNLVSFVIEPAINKTLVDYRVKVTEGDKMNVKGQKGKLQIISFDIPNSTVLVKSGRIKETMTIQELERSLVLGDVSVIPIING